MQTRMTAGSGLVIATQIGVVVMFINDVPELRFAWSRATINDSQRVRAS